MVPPTGEDLATSFNRALRSDRIAAFGGAVVLNRACDIDTAKLLSNNYLEVVCAPEFETGTLEILKKLKNLRVIKISNITRLADFEKFRFVDFKSLIDGGIIVQQSAINSIRSIDNLAQQPPRGKARTINVTANRLKMKLTT